MRRFAGAAGVLLSIVAVGACGSGAKAERLPYTDPHSVGLIVLYGSDGKPRTSGKVTDKPFAARAVSQAKAPAPYDQDGRKATLVAYQPRPNAEPSTWSGKFLTGASGYPDASHPTVQAPAEGLSLQQFLAEYPPQWDGLVQLRIYLGVPGEPTLNSSYATVDIKVSGDTWAVVHRSASGALRVAQPIGLPLAVPLALQETGGVPISVEVESTGGPTAGASPTGGTQAGPLPKTGADIVLLAGVGLVLVLAGLIALRVGRRRAAGSRQPRSQPTGSQPTGSRPTGGGSA